MEMVSEILREYEVLEVKMAGMKSNISLKHYRQRNIFFGANLTNIKSILVFAKNRKSGEQGTFMVVGEEVIEKLIPLSYHLCDLDFLKLCLAEVYRGVYIIMG